MQSKQRMKANINAHKFKVLWCLPLIFMPRSHTKFCYSKFAVFMATSGCTDYYIGKVFVGISWREMEVSWMFDGFPEKQSWQVIWYGCFAVPWWIRICQMLSYVDHLKEFFDDLSEYEFTQSDQFTFVLYLKRADSTGGSNYDVTIRFLVVFISLGSKHAFVTLWWKGWRASCWILYKIDLLKLKKYKHIY